MILRLLLAVLCIANLSAANDPLAGLAFVDGRARALADYSQQAVLVVRFCGHCPRSGGYLGKEVKALHAQIEKEYLPVWVVLATPDYGGGELAALDGQRSYGMGGALYAYDAANPRKIGLSNIFQSELYLPSAARPVDLGMPDDLAKAVIGQVGKAALRHRYPKPEGADAKLTEGWWAVERGRPGAFQALLTAAGKKDPAKDPVAGLCAKVKEALAARETALVAAAPSLEAYEALDGFLRDAKGLDNKAANERLKALAQEPALKDEVIARDAYQKCQVMLASAKGSEQKNGRQGLAEIAKRYPATVYGRRAADQAKAEKP